MKSIFILLSIVISTTAFAHNMIISTGYSKGDCSAPDEDLLKLAQKNALTRLPSKDYVRVSKFNQLAYNQGFDYAPDVCRSRRAWAEAAFVHKNDLNSRWFITLVSDFTNPRLDQNVPGVGKFSDEEAWLEAVKEGLKRVQIFCHKGTKGEPLIREKTKKVFNGKNWYDYFTVSFEVECEK